MMQRSRKGRITYHDGIGALVYKTPLVQCRSALFLIPCAIVYLTWLKSSSRCSRSNHCMWSRVCRKRWHMCKFLLIQNCGCTCSWIGMHELGARGEERSIGCTSWFYGVVYSFLCRLPLIFSIAFKYRTSTACVYTARMYVPTWHLVKTPPNCKKALWFDHKPIDFFSEAVFL
jgi:hypothetical protein